jgi:raffinose/stachyose/melibiose transport system substrate-binding protein
MINKIYKSLSLILSIAFISGPIYGKTTVTWWAETNADRDPVFQAKLVDVFNASQNEIELVMEFKEALNDILRTAMIAGEGPDIVETPGPSYVKEYQEAGLLSSMESYSKQYGWEELLLPWSYSAGVFDGEFYSAPKTYETMIMLYNKTLFAENGWSVPTNLTEYESLAEKIKAKGMHVFSYGSTGWQPTHEHLAGMYLNSIAGPDNVYKGLIGEKKWSDPEFVNAVELLRKHMVDDGYWSGSLENYYALGWDDFHAQFGNRGAAMMTIGTWTFGTTVSTFADITDDWDWAPFPNLTAEGGDPSYLLALGTTLSINGSSNNADAAAKVIDYVFKNKAIVLDMANDFNFGEFVIPLKFTADDFGDNVNPKVKRYLIDFAKQTGQGNYGYTTWTFWPSDPGVHIWKDMEVLWAGDITSEEFMEDHEKLWKKARKNNSLLPVGSR